MTQNIERMNTTRVAMADPETIVKGLTMRCGSSSRIKVQHFLGASQLIIMDPLNARFTRV